MARPDNRTENSLRAVKYRVAVIFLMLPGVLVMAILFNWIWDLGIARQMTKLALTLLYGGLVALFIVIFLVIGHVMKKRMSREEPTPPS